MKRIVVSWDNDIARSISRCVFTVRVRSQPFHGPRALDENIGIFLDKFSEQETCSFIGHI